MDLHTSMPDSWKQNSFLVRACSSVASAPCTSSTKRERSQSVGAQEQCTRKRLVMRRRRSESKFRAMVTRSMSIPRRHRSGYCATSPLRSRMGTPKKHKSKKRGRPPKYYSGRRSPSSSPSDIRINRANFECEKEAVASRPVSIATHSRGSTSVRSSLESAPKIRGRPSVSSAKRRSPSPSPSRFRMKHADSSFSVKFTKPASVSRKMWERHSESFECGYSDTERSRPRYGIGKYYEVPEPLSTERSISMHPLEACAPRRREGSPVCAGSRESLSPSLTSRFTEDEDSDCDQSTILSKPASNPLALGRSMSMQPPKGKGGLPQCANGKMSLTTFLSNLQMMHDDSDSEVSFVASKPVSIPGSSRRSDSDSEISFVAPKPVSISVRSRRNASMRPPNVFSPQRKGTVPKCATEKMSLSPSQSNLSITHDDSDSEIGFAVPKPVSIPVHSGRSDSDSEISFIAPKSVSIPVRSRRCMSVHPPEELRPKGRGRMPKRATGRTSSLSNLQMTHDDSDSDSEIRFVAPKPVSIPVRSRRSVSVHPPEEFSPRGRGRMPKCATGKTYPSPSLSNMRMTHDDSHSEIRFVAPKPVSIPVHSRRSVSVRPPEELSPKRKGRMPACATGKFSVSSSPSNLRKVHVNSDSDSEVSFVAPKPMRSPVRSRRSMSVCPPEEIRTERKGRMAKGPTWKISVSPSLSNRQMMHVNSDSDSDISFVVPKPLSIPGSSRRSDSDSEVSFVAPKSVSIPVRSRRSVSVHPPEESSPKGKGRIPKGAIGKMSISPSILNLRKMHDDSDSELNIVAPKPVSIPVRSRRSVSVRPPEECSPKRRGRPPKSAGRRQPLSPSSSGIQIKLANSDLREVTKSTDVRTGKWKVYSQTLGESGSSDTEISRPRYKAGKINEAPKPLNSGISGSAHPVSERRGSSLKRSTKRSLPLSSLILPAMQEDSGSKMSIVAPKALSNSVSSEEGLSIHPPENCVPKRTERPLESPDGRNALFSYPSDFQIKHANSDFSVRATRSRSVPGRERYRDSESVEELGSSDTERSKPEYEIGKYCTAPREFRSKRSLSVRPPEACAPKARGRSCSSASGRNPFSHSPSDLQTEHSNADLRVKVNPPASAPWSVGNRDSDSVGGLNSSISKWLTQRAEEQSVSSVKYSFPPEPLSLRVNASSYPQGKLVRKDMATSSPLMQDFERSQSVFSYSPMKQEESCAYIGPPRKIKYYEGMKQSEPVVSELHSPRQRERSCPAPLRRPGRGRSADARIHVEKRFFCRKYKLRKRKRKRDSLKEKKSTAMYSPERKRPRKNDTAKTYCETGSSGGRFRNMTVEGLGDVQGKLINDTKLYVRSAEKYDGKLLEPVVLLENMEHGLKTSGTDTVCKGPLLSKKLNEKGDVAVSLQNINKEHRNSSSSSQMNTGGVGKTNISLKTPRIILEPVRMKDINSDVRKDLPEGGLRQQSMLQRSCSILEYKQKGCICWEEVNRDFGNTSTVPQRTLEKTESLLQRHLVDGGNEHHCSKRVGKISGRPFVSLEDVGKEGYLAAKNFHAKAAEVIVDRTCMDERDGRARNFTASLQRESVLWETSHSGDIQRNCPAIIGPSLSNKSLNKSSKLRVSFQDEKEFQRKSAAYKKWVSGSPKHCPVHGDQNVFLKSCEPTLHAQEQILSESKKLTVCLSKYNVDNDEREDLKNMKKTASLSLNVANFPQSKSGFYNSVTEYSPDVFEKKGRVGESLKNGAGNMSERDISSFGGDANIHQFKEVNLEGNLLSFCSPSYSPGDHNDVERESGKVQNYTPFQPKDRNKMTENRNFLVSSSRNGERDRVESVVRRDKKEILAFSSSTSHSPMMRKLLYEASLFTKGMKPKDHKFGSTKHYYEHRLLRKKMKKCVYTSCGKQKVIFLKEAVVRLQRISHVESDVRSKDCPMEESEEDILNRKKKEMLYALNLCPVKKRNAGDRSPPKVKLLKDRLRARDRKS